MPQQQRQFNFRLSKARNSVEHAFGRLKGKWWCLLKRIDYHIDNVPHVVAAEHAFGRLKGRWQCLLKRMDYHIDNVPHVVAACVVLHNICETLGDRCQNDWVVQENANATVDERGSGNDNHIGGAAGTGHGTPTSRAIRDAFADYLSSL